MTNLLSLHMRKMYACCLQCTFVRPWFCKGVLPGMFTRPISIHLNEFAAGHACHEVVKPTCNARTFVFTEHLCKGYHWRTNSVRCCRSRI